MSWQKADPFRPRNYNSAKERGYTEPQRKGSLQLGTTGRGIGSLDIYLPEAQYDDIDHTTNRRGEINKIQQTQTSFPRKPPPGRRRCLIMTVVVSVVVVTAVVVPVIVVWKSGQFGGDQPMEQGAVLKNSGKDLHTGINDTTASSSVSSSTPTVRTVSDSQTTMLHEQISILSSSTTQSTQTSPITSPTTTEATKTSPTTSSTTTKATKTSPTTSPTTTKATKTSPTTSPTTTKATKTSPTTSSTTTKATKTSPITSSTATKATKTSPITSPTTTKATKTSPITSPTTQTTQTSLISSSTTTKITQTSPISSSTTTKITQTSPISSSTTQSTQTSPVSSSTTTKATSSTAGADTSVTSTTIPTKDTSTTETTTLTASTHSETSSTDGNSTRGLSSYTTSQSTTEITATTTTTTTTTSTSTTPSPTLMKMFGSETLLDYGSASVICGIANPRNWRHVTLRHIDLNGNERGIYKLEKGHTPKRGTGLDPNKISITWYVTPTDIYLLVAFKPASCEDVGSYYCDLISHSANKTAVASITVKAMPSRPSLTIPGTLVAGQRTDVTCSGNVGFPGGMMLIFVKNTESDILKEIGPSDGLTMTRTRANCHNYVESVFPFTPVSGGNNTSIICMVENGVIANDIVRQVSKADLTILPEGLCVGSSQTVSHPFTCAKFITCHMDGPTVLMCPEDTCYDVTTSACQNEAATSSNRAVLVMEARDIIKNTTSPITTCRVTDVTGPYNLTISHARNNDVFEHLVSVLPNTLTSSAYVTSRNITPAVTRAMGGVSVTLVPGAVTCSNSGLYRCLLVTESEKMSKSARVNVNAYHTKPSLILDTDLTAGKSTRAQCKGSVGAPGGKIRWYLKPASMDSFMELNIAVDTTEKLNCSNQVVSSFVYTPVMAANGSVLKCVSTNDNYPSVSREETSDSRQLLLLTGYECSEASPDTKISYPYSCNKYIFCSGSSQTVHACADGECFDPEAQTCLDDSS